MKIIRALIYTLISATAVAALYWASCWLFSWFYEQSILIALLSLFVLLIAGWYIINFYSTIIIKIAHFLKVGDNYMFKSVSAFGFIAMVAAMICVWSRDFEYHGAILISAIGLSLFMLVAWFTLMYGSSTAIDKLHWERPDE